MRTSLKLSIVFLLIFSSLLSCSTKTLKGQRYLANNSTPMVTPIDREVVTLGYEIAFSSDEIDAAWVEANKELRAFEQEIQQANIKEAAESEHKNRELVQVLIDAYQKMKNKVGRTWKEFQLNRNKIVTPKSLEAQERFRAYVEDLCRKAQECIIRKGLRKWGIANDWIVEFTDGWAFRISLDNAVIELITSPTTPKQMKVLAERMENYLFAAAREIGLTTEFYQGGGHIHLGVASSFQGNPVLFRNFIVDFYNNPEVWGEILGDYRNPNTPTISELPEEYVQEFYRIIKEFDEGQHQSIYELAKQIEERVYQYSSNGWKPTRKYQMLNFTRIVDYPDDPKMQTIELRNFQEHQSLIEVQTKTEMVIRRLEKMSRINGLVDILEPELMLEKKKNGTREQKIKSAALFLDEIDMDFNEDAKKINPKFVGRYQAAEEDATIRLGSEVVEHTGHTRAINKNVKQSRSCFSMMNKILKPQNLLRFGW